MSVVFLSACSNEKEITANDLATSLSIRTFIIELPSDFNSTTKLALEVVDKDGIRISKNLQSDRENHGASNL
jgi:hypothetical protein